ncbi:hypothetical protein I309_04465 [Cryptococcus deuterogattii LA55]|nr:hypothetical protein I309_04465 [Cryptococcus deuterogattii LA55]KIR93761.1 hypothetical protein I304_02437 [Cryptococcus deuterogattii CBS 10090]
MADDILCNCAALRALKRHQLVSLSKKYGLKASGKNIDMIDRLQKYGQKYAGNLDLYIPDPAPTPVQDLVISSTVTAADRTISLKLENKMPDPEVPVPFFSSSSLAGKPSDGSLISRPSDSWEVLSDSAASIVSKEDTERPESSSHFQNVGLWKSSNNGEALTASEGSAEDCDTRNSGSMRAITSSISKRGSIILLGLDRLSSSTPSDQHNREMAAKIITTGPHEKGEDHLEVVVNTPPSPASTVGIARRHSRHSLQERPSTIRLCSPTPSSFVQGMKPLDDVEDELPFVGKMKDAGLRKERRSMAPSVASQNSSDVVRLLVRTSMPALSIPSAPSTSNVYPPLPNLSPYHINLDQTCENQEESHQVPGGFPPLPPPPSRTQVLFGNSIAPVLSNAQFSEAAQNILQEMNARLPKGSARLGEELLKGKHAEMEKLVYTNQKLGTGGWGLSEDTTHVSDLYAESHGKEFANPDGASSGALEGSEERQAKRSRLSTHPFGTLREAKKNIAIILSEEKGVPQTSMLRKLKDRRERRRSGFHEKDSSKKFGFLKKKIGAEPAATLASSSSASKPIISHPCPLSYKISTEVSHASRSSLQLSPSEGYQCHVRNLKNGGRSTSAQTVISQTGSKTPRRAGIPDFAPPSVTNRESSGTTSLVSTNSLGLPEPSSPFRRPGFPSSSRGSSTTRAMKKQNQAKFIRNARSAPLPPKHETIDKTYSVLAATQKVSTTSLGSIPKPPTSIIHRHSTLFRPTVSSLARMQATVKPKADIPPPTIPPTSSALLTSAVRQKHVLQERECDPVHPIEIVAASHSIKTIQPFGNATSRENAFETNIMSKPAATSCKGGPSHGKGIIKKQSSASLAAARARAKASGLKAVKSRGDLREKEKEMRRKKEEMRVLSCRRKEERELREMLGM